MSFESPISVLQNLAGEEVAIVSGSTLNSGEQPGVAILAKDNAGNAQFLNLNESGELLVNAAVDVELSASTDSITVWGDRAAFVQDEADDVLLVRDNTVKDAVEAAAGDITGSIGTMDSNLSGKLETLDASVAAAAGDITGSINAMNTSLGSKLDLFNFDSNALVVTGNLNVDVALTTDDEVTVYQGTDPWNVSATDLDIRDLNYASDSVSIYGDEGTAFAQVSGSGEMIVVPLGNEGNSFLQAASGSVHADDDGNGALLVGLLGSNSKNILQSSANDILMVSGAGNFNVVATDLDIRNLSSETDNVSAVQSGDWIVRKHTTSAAVSTASASTSDAEVLASNANRMGATFFMDGNATCYIKLGGAASNSDFSVRIVNNGYYELPEGYVGAIHAAFSTTDAGIKLRITELSYV